MSNEETPRLEKEREISGVRREKDRSFVAHGQYWPQ
jgi:hypothetical protein